MGGAGLRLRQARLPKRSSEGQGLHGSARTTEAVHRAVMSHARCESRQSRSVLGGIVSLLYLVAFSLMRTSGSSRKPCPSHAKMR